MKRLELFSQSAKHLLWCSRRLRNEPTTEIIGLRIYPVAMTIAPSDKFQNEPPRAFLSFKINSFHDPFAEGDSRLVDYVKPFCKWSPILTLRYDQNTPDYTRGTLQLVSHLAIHIFRNNRRRVSSAGTGPDVVWRVSSLEQSGCGLTIDVNCEEHRRTATTPRRGVRATLTVFDEILPN